MTLYRKPGGGGYVLHQVNYSRVWHRGGGSPSPHVRKVRKPKAVLRSALPERAVYCGSLPGRDGRDQCPPRGSDGDIAVIELPQHKVSSHPDADEVVREAMTVRRGASVSMALSEPMRDLLTAAEDNDPAFRGVRPVVRMLCRLRQTSEARIRSADDEHGTGGAHQGRYPDAGLGAGSGR